MTTLHPHKQYLLSQSLPDDLSQLLKKCCDLYFALAFYSHNEVDADDSDQSSEPVQRMTPYFACRQLRNNDTFTWYWWTEHSEAPRQEPSRKGLVQRLLKDFTSPYYDLDVLMFVAGRQVARFAAGPQCFETVCGDAEEEAFQQCCLQLVKSVELPTGSLFTSLQNVVEETRIKNLAQHVCYNVSKALGPKVGKDWMLEAQVGEQLVLRERLQQHPFGAFLESWWLGNPPFALGFQDSKVLAHWLQHQLCSLSLDSVITGDRLSLSILSTDEEDVNVAHSNASSSTKVRSNAALARVLQEFLEQLRQKSQKSLRARQD